MDARKNFFPRGARVFTKYALHIGVVKAPLCNSGLSVSHLTDGYCWPTLILVLNNLKKALKGNDHEGHLSQGDVLEARVFGLGLTRGFFPQLTTKSISVVKNT
jgi:hypothetical protein